MVSYHFPQPSSTSRPRLPSCLRLRNILLCWCGLIGVYTTFLATKYEDDSWIMPSRADLLGASADAEQGVGPLDAQDWWLVPALKEHPPAENDVIFGYAENNLAFDGPLTSGDTSDAHPQAAETPNSAHDHDDLETIFSEDAPASPISEAYAPAEEAPVKKQAPAKPGPTEEALVEKQAPAPDEGTPAAKKSRGRSGILATTATAPLILAPSPLPQVVGASRNHCSPISRGFAVATPNKENWYALEYSIVEHGWLWSHSSMAMEPEVIRLKQVYRLLDGGSCNLANGNDPSTSVLKQTLLPEPINIQLAGQMDVGKTIMNNLQRAIPELAQYSMSGRKLSVWKPRSDGALKQEGVSTNIVVGTAPVSTDSTSCCLILFIERILQLANAKPVQQGGETIRTRRSALGTLDWSSVSDDQALIANDGGVLLFSVVAAETK